MYKIIDNQVLYKLNYKLIFQIHDGKSFQGLHILFLHETIEYKLMINYSYEYVYLLWQIGK